MFRFFSYLLSPSLLLYLYRVLIALVNVVVVIVTHYRPCCSCCCTLFVRLHLSWFFFLELGHSHLYQHQRTCHHSIIPILIIFEIVTDDVNVDVDTADVIILFFSVLSVSSSLSSAFHSFVLIVLLLLLLLLLLMVSSHLIPFLIVIPYPAHVCHCNCCILLAFFSIGSSLLVRHLERHHSPIHVCIFPFT